MSGTIGGQLPLYAYYSRRPLPDPAAAAAQRADEGTASQKAQPLVAYANGLASGTMSDLLALQSSDPALQTESNPLLKKFEKLPDLNEEAHQRAVAGNRKLAASAERRMATIQSLIEKMEQWARQGPGHRSELQAAIDNAREMLHEEQQRLNSYYQFLNGAASETDTSAASTDSTASAPESQKTAS